MSYRMNYIHKNMVKNILIVGNVVFVLWIIYNGIDEGFSGTVIEKVSFIALVSLLALNTWFIAREQEKTIR